MKKKTVIGKEPKKIIILFSCLFLVLIVVAVFTQIMSLDQKGNKHSITKSKPETTKATEAAQKEQDKSTSSSAKEGTAAASEKKLFFYDTDDIYDKIYNSDTAKTYPSLVYKPKPSDNIDKITKEDSKGQNKKSQDSKSNRPKNIIIDESSENIKDDTIQNEYKGEKSQGPINFFNVKPEKGADVNGDVPAGGKQNVGKWN